jgi:hypothetical protein
MPPSTIIVLDSESESPEVQSITSPERNDSKQDTSDNDSASDEEFAELARRARERARRRHADLENKILPAEDVTRSETTATLSVQSCNAPPQSRDGNRERPAKDPIVEIFITSELVNTKPLIVQRKLSQPLRDVRKAWCSRQGFGPEMAASVFLTWKGKRLFDVTTCKGLGIAAEEANDPLYMGDNCSPEHDDIRVYMEAVTEESFGSRKRHMNVGGGREVDESELDRAEEISETVLRITLKSPGLEDFKIKVRPTTRVSNIIKNFRDMRSIPQEMSILMQFDGERLDPNSVVEENDIADLDSIDVRVMTRKFR